MIKFLSVASLAFALTAPSFAQVKTTVVPPGYDTKDAPSYSYYHGGYPSAHQQYLETLLTGKGLKLVTRVGYRRDYRSTVGYGRTWKNVTLQAVETKFRPPDIRR